jgi:Zn-dependent protease
MMMDVKELLWRVCTEAPPIVFAITVHETAHGYAALWFGDTTAQRAGRLSLNPLRHVDLFGTLLLPAVLLFMGLPAFGWAKPVPVEPCHLRRRDMLWVSSAGPASNALMAILWAALFKLAGAFQSSAFLGAGFGDEGRMLFKFLASPESLPIYALESMALTGIGINLLLMTFNLIPLPPLDGGRIAASLLPAPLAVRFSRIEPFGLLILIGVLFSGVLDRILFPLVGAQFGLLFRIFNLETLS